MYDPNPTSRDHVCAAVTELGLKPAAVSRRDDAVTQARQHGAPGSGRLAALMLDASADPGLSEAILRAILQVPGIGDIAGILLVDPGPPPAIASTTGLPTVTRPLARSRLQRALLDCLPDLPANSTMHNEDASIRCDLSLLPLHELLPSLARRRVTGDLRVEAPGIECRFVLDRGRLLRGVDETDALDLPDLAARLEREDSIGHDECAALVEGGELDAAALLAAVRIHALDHLGRCVSLDEGSASFSPRTLDGDYDAWAQARRDPSITSIPEAVLHGLRQAESLLAAGARSVEMDQIPLRRDDVVARMKQELSEEELALLELCNGRSTLKEIARRAKLGALAAATICLRLTAVGALEPRVTAARI